MSNPVTREVAVGNLRLGGSNGLFLIAGPCVIESEAHARSLAERIAGVCAELKLPYVFKTSFDKANRTSGASYRGPGVEAGLRVLRRIKSDLKVAVLTDVHEPAQVGPAAEVADILQIPAFLCRQTDLLVAAGKSGRAVNVKKGQFVSPWEMKHAIEKVAGTGNTNILVTERGSSFGYNNLVVDMRSFPVLRGFGYPVVFDVTHSLQLPGGEGNQSGGQRQFAEPLARAAAAAGGDGIFMEVHD
ncbi:MAG: 3-deoxy-8-phosphooctulonate synthase, partial [Candidatus Acidiferrales bacterium]